VLDKRPGAAAEI
jgi:hypothetical protein